MNRKMQRAKDTGLNDKYGAGIYEDDLVRIDGMWPCVYRVTYDEGSGAFALVCGNDVLPIDRVPQESMRLMVSRMPRQKAQTIFQPTQTSVDWQRMRFRLDEIIAARFGEEGEDE